MDQHKWDKRFLEMAELVASWSKDPSTQVGAVAVDDQRRVLAMGYNGFPRGIEDSPERYENRGWKLDHVVHAEKNLIYNATWAGVSLNGATVYVHGLPICHQCSLGLIQTGIKRVVMFCNDMRRWEESWEQTKLNFEEAGIEWNLKSNQ